ncbi:HD domain-containing protein [Chitinophaga pinensis]|uniref:Metal dependent phosphohydrolase n=1 Tax=Chitinophaga pinensis (strain ATCC 43595 / DSM 2588 / LMG 13176 / NBRC 15968 / NCIMB 11800 / UQM 2034) TaxID=485918 RepID=A0A979GAW6_CHIPD|nr:HD domain-containing protein [Chitinophaga pinensis]ACU64164.1 metal dependent phosphohydrolase [Chitinophaga pinensis DSM 2588]
MPVTRLSKLAGVDIPDSQVAKQATELLLEHGTEFLYNHSLRVFLFSSLNAKRNNIKYDTELLYISAVFHDLGLVPHYSSPDKRFEVDGANAARDFLKSHGYPEQSLQRVWDTIALHTTIGIAEYKEPEVALMYSGVGLDVMGEGYEHLSTENREAIIKAFPRTDFKQKIIPTFFDGFKHKTDTTFGNIKADVCAFMIPDFQRKNFCDCIVHSPWEE